LTDANRFVLSFGLVGGAITWRSDTARSGSPGGVLVSTKEATADLIVFALLLIAVELGLDAALLGGHSGLTISFVQFVVRIIDLEVFDSAIIRDREERAIGLSRSKGLDRLAREDSHRRLEFRLKGDRILTSLDEMEGLGIVAIRDLRERHIW
jgi:hypothetical protein